MAHSYFFAGEQEQGIEAATVFAETELGLQRKGNADLIIFRYGLFSVDDARRVIRLADQAPVTGDKKIIVLAVERLFHEAQNALLKLFEEPSPGTTLVLVLPSAGLILPTLRSRMLVLPSNGEVAAYPEAHHFLTATFAEREKLIAKLLERTKADKDEDKQAARGEALRLVEGLMQIGYDSIQKKENAELRVFLSDLDRFIPILHERSAPYKLIFEHILLTLPKGL